MLFRSVAEVVSQSFSQIEAAVDEFVKSFRGKGRVFYVGAGTSGRLGVLDASELPPTFGIPSERVQGLIAGGKTALYSAQEGVEDYKKKGKKLVDEMEMSEEDFVIGISASGTTPYVIGCLKQAKEEGITTACITNNRGQKLEEIADIPIVAPTGPEVIAGSTRMKAGTAGKMILNMISTASMVELGKVYDNMMVDLKGSNKKLKKRAKKMLLELTNKKEEIVMDTLEETDFRVKLALVMLKAGVDKGEARQVLEEVSGSPRGALDKLGC